MAYCLRDYIGLKWCGDQVTPPSGLWINAFPGVSFNQMQSISDSEQKTFAGVWSDIRDRAQLSPGGPARPDGRAGVGHRRAAEGLLVAGPGELRPVDEATAHGGAASTSASA